MIVFRDMTYCVREDCVNESCRRRLDQDVRTLAARSGLPLSISDFGPSCEDYRKKDDE